MDSKESAVEKYLGNVASGKETDSALTLNSTVWEFRSLSSHAFVPTVPYEMTAKSNALVGNNGHVAEPLAIKIANQNLG